VVDGTKIKSQFSAIALLLGWFELFLMLGQLPFLSVQLEMFKRVSRTFLKFTMGCVSLLIAFACSSYVLFEGFSEQGDAELFDNPLAALAQKTGMLSYQVIHLLLVFLVSNILSNLLSALASSDTDVVRKNAETISLVARVKLTYSIEGLVNALPKSIKPDIELKKDMFEIYPNVRNRTASAAAQSLLSIISEKKKSNEQDILTAVLEKLNMFTEKFSELELRQKQMEENVDLKLDNSRQILMKIQTHLGIGN
jgi:hypothetical protein